MAVIAKLPEGKIIADGQSDAITVPVAGGAQGVTVPMRDLRKVIKVLQINVTTDPVVDVSVPENIKVTGNVVGMTLVCGAGTTLTVECTALGF
jgi:hypothetical protein